MLSKQVYDSAVSFHAFNLLGNLLYTLKIYKEALLIFEFLRDMANEFHNFAHLILAYENLAKICNDMQDHDRSLIAAKKMMQVSWFLCSHEFELYAYEQTARAYFYLGNVDKVKFYSDRVLNGIVEPHDSVERIIAVEMLINEQKLKTKMGKYEKLNFKVSRKRSAKEIDMTHQDYDMIWTELDKINDSRILKKTTSMRDMMMSLKDRTVGSRIVRMSSPLTKFDRGKKIQSPMSGHLIKRKKENVEKSPPALFTVFKGQAEGSSMSVREKRALVLASTLMKMKNTKQATNNRKAEGNATRHNKTNLNR